MECTISLGIGITGRVFHLFRLFHLREWNTWKSRNSWSIRDRLMYQSMSSVTIPPGQIFWSNPRAGLNWEPLF